MSVNKVILLGRLGQDPELKYTPGGMSVCNFSMATSENWTDKGGQKQERTEWHRIVVWGKQAENCNKYLKKGRMAFIEGRLQTRSWDDKTGQKRYTTEIVANAVQFVDGNRQEQGAAMNNAAAEPNAPAHGAPQEEYQVPTDTNFTADDIPF